MRVEGAQAALLEAEHRFVLRSVHANVHQTLGDHVIGSGRFGRAGDIGHDGLAVHQLVAFFSPEAVFTQAQAAVQHVFAGLGGNGYGQIKAAGFAGRHVGLFDHASLHNRAVAVERPAQVVLISIAKQAAVFQRYAGSVGRDDDGLVEILDLLHARCFGTVAKEQAVAAEVAVGGTIAKVAAPGQTLPAIGRSGEDGLIHKVPDEAALIARVALFQLDVLEHAAAAVAHGMGVLAQDEGLFGVFG